MKDLINKLSGTSGIEALEDVSDELMSQAMLAEKNPDQLSKDDELPDVEILGRVRDQRVLKQDSLGLIYARQENKVRKFYVHNLDGECQINLYNSFQEFTSGIAPFLSNHIVAGYKGKIFFPTYPKTVYARVETTSGPHHIYIHMEWWA